MVEVICKTGVSALCLAATMSAPLLSIRPAATDDVPVILSFIRELAEYEKLEHEVSATPELLHEGLFGMRPSAEALIGCVDGEPAGFALFFPSFSTFLTKPGIYLEDLYVRPKFRGLGLGKRLLIEVARLAGERGSGRYEWSVLDWNAPSIRFYEALGAVMHADWRRMRVEGESLAKMAATLR
jgi:GNAT superfamily N-acetyltransferase